MRFSHDIAHGSIERQVEQDTMVRRHFLAGQPTDPKEGYAKILRFVGIDLDKRFFRQDSPKIRRKLAAIARSGSPDTFFFRGNPEILKLVRRPQGNAL